jgi:hypothetical protein
LNEYFRRSAVERTDALSIKALATEALSRCSPALKVEVIAWNCQNIESASAFFSGAVTTDCHWVVTNIVNCALMTRKNECHPSETSGIRRELGQRFNYPSPALTFRSGYSNPVRVRIFGESLI